MNNATKWIHRNGDHIAERHKLAEAVNMWNISETFAEIMLNREVGDIGKFLAPSERDLHDPFLFEDMEIAVAKIIETMNNGEKITVYGDYDVDGITAVSIILNYFEGLGYDNISWYVPNRHEGYGVNKAAIQKIAEDGTKLIITVDCGITSLAEVELANSLGMTVIVTDHHEQGEELPKALAVINPKRLDTQYPYKGICGACVAFKLMLALHTRLENKPDFSDNLAEFYDFVAFATIADIVPLTDENRYFVQKGLKYFNAGHENKRETFSKLVEVAGYKDKPVTAETIGFYLAPRINAIGRLDDARPAIEYFNEIPEEDLGEAAILLNKKNEERKSIEAAMQEKILTMLPPVEKYEDFTIVVADPSFHTGIKGIVASKIQNLYNRPTIIFNENGDLLEGSCRSIEGLDMKKALDYCSDLLLKYGGHTAAAGLTLTKENFEAFKTKFEQYAREQLTVKDLVPCFYYDCVVNVNELTNQLMRDMDLFAPYGEQNPAPNFVCRNATVLEKKTMGAKNEHLKLKITQNGISIWVIAFHMAHLYDSIQIMSKIDILFKPQENTWQGKTEIQIHASDIKLSGSAEEVNLNEVMYDTLSFDKCDVMIDQDLIIYKDEINNLFVAKGDGTEIGTISPKLAAKIIYNFTHYKMYYKVKVTSIEYLDGQYKVVIQLTPVAKQ